MNHLYNNKLYYKLNGEQYNFLFLIVDQTKTPLRKLSQRLNQI